MLLFEFTVDRIEVEILTRVRMRAPRCPCIVAAMTPKTLTVAEAAKASGLSEKAIRRRIDRKTLRTVTRNGRVHVYVHDLVEAGVPVDPLVGHERGIGDEGGPQIDPAVSPSLVDLVRDLAAQVVEAEARAARATALLESAEVRERSVDVALVAVQAQVVEKEAKVAELQARPCVNRLAGS